MVTDRASQLPDAQLLEQFVARQDQAAFAGLVRRHGPMVWAVCQRLLSNRQDAEDAFQATFLVLARRAKAIARRERVGGWLHGVAHRTALRLRAQSRRWQSLQPLPETLAAPEALPELARRELKLVLDEEIQR